MSPEPIAGLSGKPPAHGSSRPSAVTARDNPFHALGTPVPVFDRETAGLLLRENYGLAATLERLSSERDLNFLATTADSERFVLKFASAAESSGVTDFQNRALEHIADVDPDLPIPRVVRTLDGERMFKVTALSGTRHNVRLLTWLDGVPLARAPASTRIAGQLGRCLARLDLALKGFAHPAADYPLLWDIRNTSLLGKLLEFIEDPQLRALCETQIEYFADRVEPALDRLRRQVIYNDLNPSNVLVRADQPGLVAGIIDFGDMVRSHLINDIAVAAAYLCASGEDPYGQAVDFLEDYHRLLPLREDEILLLPDLILARHLTTVMITHWRASMYPENRVYILRSEGRARKMTEAASRELLDRTAARFLEKCTQITRQEPAA